MSFLSKRIMTDVGLASWRRWRIRPSFMDITGHPAGAEWPMVRQVLLKARSSYAFQESINMGRPFVWAPVRDLGIRTWIMALEDRRRIFGGLVGGEAWVEAADADPGPIERYWVSLGVPVREAARRARALPHWTEAQLDEVMAEQFTLFYRISGWKPVLLQENHLKVQQKAQIQQAMEDQRGQGVRSLYAFEKERSLLANIRAGARPEARRILNEMLAAIYLTSPGVSLLQARAVELMSYLTRAAIEDNPLLEPLMGHNHMATEHILKAGTMEEISETLMRSLDEFIDAVYDHGVNRASAKVRMAIDYIRLHYAEALTLQDVARVAGVSVFRLAHLFKEHTGRTVLEHLFEIRIRQVQSLLQRTDLTGLAIAHQVGFGDQSSMIRYFVRFTGTTPSRYRRARRGRIPD